ncbi:MAG: CDP-alcohol phosphatidyltransferase family protein [Candidatus Nanoarchaeia archaeon]
MLERYSKLRSKLLRPFLFKANPNYLSILAFIFALVAGYAFYKNLLLLAALFVLLNGLFDTLDGEIARHFKLETKFGDFLDHSLDRLADTAILLGIAFNPNFSMSLALFALIAVLLVSYLGTEAQVLTGKRLYTAVVGRADRILIIAAAALLTTFIFPKAIDYALFLMIVLAAISFAIRFFLIAKQL